jgi:uncharacterized membrane protein YfcA
MELLLLKVLIGFTVGTLIGFTGLGGGVLLLPMLIFGLVRVSWGSIGFPSVIPVCSRHFLYPNKVLKLNVMSLF